MYIPKNILVLSFGLYDIRNWQTMFLTLGQLVSSNSVHLLGNYAICINGNKVCILECYNRNEFGNYPGGNLAEVDIIDYDEVILDSSVESVLIAGEQYAHVWTITYSNHSAQLTDHLSFIYSELPTLISNVL